MTIQWTEALSVGVLEIDNQHKELFKRINDLFDACHQGKGKGVVNGVISFLENYVVTHFDAEENYMKKYAYPEYAAHKVQHTDFIASFASLKGELVKTGPGVHIVILTNRLVVDWLQKHINKSDKALGAFLKNKLSK